MKRSNAIFRGLRSLISSGEKSNWKVVALCFLGATTFWFFNALNKNYGTRLSYPVEFAFDSDGVVVTKELPQRVRIDVSGGGWNLLRKTMWLNPQPIQIMLDNPASQRYITKSSLTPLIADQLKDIRLNYVVTDTLFLNIERLEDKEVVLRVDSAGLPLAPGYQLTSPISLEPNVVTFTGPISYIDTLADTLYLPLHDLEDIREDYSETHSMAALAPGVVQVYPPSTDLQFKLRRYLDERRLVRIRKVNFPDERLRLADSLSVVTFRVPEEELEEVQRTGFYVEADYETFNPADSTVSLQLVAYPPGVIDPSLDLERVKVFPFVPQFNPLKNR